MKERRERRKEGRKGKEEEKVHFGSKPKGPVHPGRRAHCQELRQPFIS